MLPECFLESLAQGQTVISPVWNAESPACRLLAKVVFVAVLCLGGVWKAAPQLHGCVYLKSVSVAALGGAQAGALGAYFWAARGFLLLPLLLFPPALRGPSLHPQVVDPVGLWVGDFAEGHFVDGRVFWVYQQEEQRGEAERPGADWQPELEGTEQTQGCTWVPLFGLFACVCLRLNSCVWEAGSVCALPEGTVATTCGFSCPHRGLWFTRGAWGCTKHLTLQTSVLSEVELQFWCWMEPGTNAEAAESGFGALMTAMKAKTPSSHVDSWIF